MEEVEQINVKTDEVSSAEPLCFTVLDENEEEAIIQMNILNNQLIFEITPKNDDINSYYRTYISRNSLDILKQNYKIFSSYQTLLEIKNHIHKLISDEENNKIIKENNKYTLIINDKLKFNFNSEEKNLKKVIKELLLENQKKSEENAKMRKEMDALKKELNEIKNENNIFLGEGVYYILSAIDQKKCLDLIPSKGCWNLIINDFKKNNSQKFRIKTENCFEHTIKYYHNNNIIISLNVKEKDKIESGIKIIAIDELNIGNNQKWFFTKYGEFICIKSCSNRNFVIDVPARNTNNFNEINIWQFNGHNNQLWKFVKAE